MAPRLKQLSEESSRAASAHSPPTTCSREGLPSLRRGPPSSARKRTVDSFGRLEVFLSSFACRSREL
jgi:hypothetical protein